MEDGRFAGKVALVTGSAQGIGRATALRLAREGAQVFVVDRARDQNEELRDEIAAAGGTAVAFTADLETHAGAEAVVMAALDAFGRIDVAVHNVGGTIWAKPFWEYQPEEIEKEIRRSLWPTLWCCRAVIPVMIRQKGGTIVNVGSNATRGIYRVPYSAAKGGVHAMTTCMALELAPHNIRVNAVSPGAIDNGVRAVPRNPLPQSEQEQQWGREMYADILAGTPQRRMGTKEEVAATICFFASDEAGYITGQTCFVAGGTIG